MKFHQQPTKSLPKWCYDVLLAVEVLAVFCSIGALLAWRG